MLCFSYLISELSCKTAYLIYFLLLKCFHRTTEPEEREHSKSSSRKRPRSPSPVEEDEEYEDESDERYISHSGSGKEDNWQQYSDHEDFEDGRGYSPELTYSPPSMSRDKTLHKENQEHKSSYKEKHRSEMKNLNPEKKKEKLASKEPQKDFSSHAGSSREKLPFPESKDRTPKKEKNRHSVSKSQTDDVLDAKILKHQEKSKPDKHKIGLEPAEKGKVLEKNLVTKEKSDKTKKKTEPNDSGTHDKKSIKLSLPPAEHEEDVFEQPTMSFESYLSYDQPRNIKKKKKPTVKVTSSTPEKSTKKQSESKEERKEKSKSKQQTPVKKEKKESKVRHKLYHSEYCLKDAYLF